MPMKKKKTYIWLNITRMYTLVLFVGERRNLNARIRVHGRWKNNRETRIGGRKWRYR